MFISIARDQEENIRVYMNTGDFLYCTDALTLQQATGYLQIIAEALLSFTDPLKVTTWNLAVKGTTFPGTARKAIGFNESHSEIWARQFDAQGRSRKANLVEEGKRGIINTTFIVTLSKLFFTDLEKTLQEQKDTVFETNDHGKAKRESTNV